jgi:hypothetical protein
MVFGAARCEATRRGWNEALYRIWYLTGAVWTAGWLGLGTAYLLGRTRFGFGFALCLFLAGLFTFLTASRNRHLRRCLDGRHAHSSQACWLWRSRTRRTSRIAPLMALMAVGGRPPSLSSLAAFAASPATRSTHQS